MSRTKLYDLIEEFEIANNFYTKKIANSPQDPLYQDFKANVLDAVYESSGREIMEAVITSVLLEENFPVPRIKHSFFSYVLSWNENSEESKLMLDAIFAKLDLPLNEEIYHMSFAVSALAAAFYNKNYSAIASILTHDNFDFNARIHSDLLHENTEMDAIAFLRFKLSTQKAKAKLETKDPFYTKVSILLNNIEQACSNYQEDEASEEESSEQESSEGYGMVEEQSSEDNDNINYLDYSQNSYSLQMRGEGSETESSEGF